MVDIYFRGFSHDDNHKINFKNINFENSAAKFKSENKRSGAELNQSHTLGTGSISKDALTLLTAIKLGIVDIKCSMFF